MLPVYDPSQIPCRLLLSKMRPRSIRPVQTDLIGDLSLEISASFIVPEIAEHLVNLPEVTGGARVAFFAFFALFSLLRL
jgi:hypothetical protein